MKKKAIITVVFAALALVIAVLLTGCGDATVATVNGQAITKSQLDREVKFRYGSQAGDPSSSQYKQLETQMLDTLITQQIINAEAQKRGITVSDDEINKAIDQQKQAAGGADKFKKKMSDAGVSDDQLSSMMKDNIYFQKLLADVTRDAANVTDQQALDYYNQHKGDGTFQAPEQRQVRHILVADQATAQKIEAQLKSGADFAALAKQYSTDTASKDKGGELGTVPSQNSGFVPAFEQAMDKLAAGQISDPVKTQFGWHIIQVEKIIPAGTQTFDQVKDNLKQGLMLEQQRQAFDKWLLDTRPQYKITYSDGYGPVQTTGAAGQTAAGTTGAGH
ncbi:MAG: peptidyl-prolyl cis-trans isomerase [Thermoleophilia bacterium]